MSGNGTTTPSGLRLNPNERREHILRAALEAFHTKGYGQTSVRDLADAVGMSIAGMYHYFAAKDDILFAIIESAVDRLLAELTAARDSAETPEARIRTMLGATVRVVVENRAEIRIQLDNADKLAPERRETIRDRLRESVRMVRAEFEQLQVAGQLEELDLNVVTFALYGMANWVYHWYDPDGPVEMETLTDQLAEILFHGVLK